MKAVCTVVGNVVFDGDVIFINAKKSYYNVLKDSLEIVVFKYNAEAFDFEVMNNDFFIV